MVTGFFFAVVTVRFFAVDAVFDAVTFFVVVDFAAGLFAPVVFFLAVAFARAEPSSK